MYQRILVPIDGSAPAEAGLAEAARLARATGATLHLVHVLDLRPWASGFDASIGFTGGALEEARASSQALLRTAEAQAQAAGLKVETRLIETYTARASDLIVDEALAARVDLVVIGTHGRRGLGRLLLGSDAEQVLRRSPVPVLLVRGPSGAAAAAGTADLSPAEASS